MLLVSGYDHLSEQVDYENYWEQHEDYEDRNVDYIHVLFRLHPDLGWVNCIEHKRDPALLCQHDKLREHGVGDVVEVEILALPSASEVHAVLLGYDQVKVDLLLDLIAWELAALVLTWENLDEEYAH